MSDLVEQQILPQRTAAEQFRLAGVESSVRTFNPQTRIYYIGGKGGPCAMHEQEWNDYQALCARWSSGPLDLDGAPGISMLVATSEEEVELAALRLRPRSYLACAFEEIERLLIAHETCLDELDREDMRRTMAGKLMTLKEAVLRAEEIWQEDKGGPDAA